MGGSFAAGRDFIYRQGRVLERRLFAALFEDGPSSGVVDALSAHRNPDGGFGHGLEPDKRCPDSQPLDVELALQALDDVGEFGHELVGNACDYLGRISSDGGVPLATSAVLDYPHAEHWGEWAFAPALNPTAGLVGLCLKNGIDHPWLERATKFCDAALQADDWGDAHSLLEVLSYADHAGRPEIVQEVGRRLPSARLYKSDPRSPEYGVTPLQFAPRPGGAGGGLFSEGLLDDHLEALVEAQEEDGGWPLTWMPPSEAAVLEWRGIRTLWALRVLSAYGRLDAKPR